MTVSDSGPAPVSGRVLQVLGHIPQRNKNFTGREDILALLRNELANSVTVVLPHALQGLGGVGKTQVAIEYAYRYSEDYDLIWWIPADHLPLVRASLAALAPKLGLAPAEASGSGIERQLCKGHSADVYQASRITGVGAKCGIAHAARAHVVVHTTPLSAKPSLAVIGRLVL